MAYIINLPTFNDERGSLTVAEQSIPFEIKRVFYIYNIQGKRGGHGHKKAINALICLHGSCKVNIKNDKEESSIILNEPNQCLILNPIDWHTMDNCSENALLLVLSSEPYCKDDYVFEAPS